MDQVKNLKQDGKQKSANIDLYNIGRGSGLEIKEGSGLEM
jgi:hypothetical protein